MRRTRRSRARGCRQAIVAVASRSLFGAALGLMFLFGEPRASAQPSPDDFASLRAELWPDAQARGVSRATFDAAFDGLSPDPRVAALTKRQPEYGKAVGAYLASAVSPARIDAGKRKARDVASVLNRVEATYQVDRWVLLAVWGLETSYGADKLRWDVIRSLATLVSVGYRAAYFRGELIDALRMLQEGQIARDKLLGSWAGAMGQPQFMPSSYFAYAVDASGDGRRDIWSDAADILGSMANYLRKQGWTPGIPWGFEVIVPPGFDYRQSRGSFAAWTQRGLKRADGGAMPAAGDAILFFPSGAAGPAFLVTANFEALKRYNNSDVYALAVGHLADRLRGGAPIRKAWPADDPQLPREERMALQRMLAERGYPVHDFEGRIDFDLRDAIREQQVRFGMTPDGHPTAALLQRLRAP